MNLNQLATGILSGYATKALQLVASLVLVPFLLAPDILGIEEYGRAFAMLGVTGMFSLAVVGIQYAAERAISTAVGEAHGRSSRSSSEITGSVTKVLLVASLAYITPLLALNSVLLPWLGIPLEPRYLAALLAAGLISLFENSFYLLRVPLIARGDIAFVNIIGMLEVAGRTLSIFIVFSSINATVAKFLMIQAFFTFSRQLAFFLRLDGQSRSEILRSPISGARITLRYAGPVSIVEGSTLLVRNIPVVLASRFLSPTEAGFVALVANTIQGYILQTFLAVFQPVAIPIAARIRLPDLTPLRRRRFLEIEALYGLAIALLFGQAILWTPHFVPIWLGPDFDQIILPTQVMIAGCGIQTSSLIRRAILLANGALPRTIPVVSISALVSLASILVGVAWFDSWTSAIIFSAAHVIVANGLGVDGIFASLIGKIDARVRASHVLSVGLTFVLVWLIGHQMSSTSIGAVLVASLAAIAATFCLSSLTLISPRRAIEILSLLYSRRGSDLFR